MSIPTLEIEVKQNTDTKQWSRTIRLPETEIDQGRSYELPLELPRELDYLNQYVLEREQRQKLGEALYKALFDEAATEAYRRYTTGRHQLCIVIVESAESRESVSIPWEFMHDGSRYLIASPRVQLRRSTPAGRNALQEETAPAVKKPLRMLIAWAEPSDQNPIDINREQLYLAQALARGVREDLIITELLHCTRSKLTETLKEQTFDIIYFSGHGIFDKDKGGSLCLENEGGSSDLLSSQDLEDLFLETEKPPLLVILNACQTGMANQPQGAGNQERTQKQPNDMLPFRDVSRTLLRAGICFVIGTTESVYVRPSQLFIKSFFKNFFAGNKRDIPKALNTARREVLQEYIKKELPSDETRRMALGYETTAFQYTLFSGIPADWEITYTEPKVPPTTPDILGRVAESDNPLWLRRNDLVDKIEKQWVRTSRQGIYGIGGLGKTVAGNIIAQRANTQGNYDRVFWLDLRKGTHEADIQTRLLEFLELDGVPTSAMKMESQLSNIPLIRKLRERFGTSCLIVIDNAEDLLKKDGSLRFKDPKAQQLLKELLLQTKWHALFTSRVSFSFLEHRRDTLPIEWNAVSEFTIYEQAAYLALELEADGQLGKEQIKLTESQQGQILKGFNGHPYELNLLVSDYAKNRHLDIRERIAEIQEETAEMAALHYYLSHLSVEELQVLQLLCLLDMPKSPDELKRLLPEDLRFSTDLAALLVSLSSKGFALKNKEEAFYTLPVLDHYLLEQENSHTLPKAKQTDYYQHFARVLYVMNHRANEEIKEGAKKGDKRFQVMVGKSFEWLHEAMRYSLQQPDLELSAGVLEEFASQRQGRVPSSQLRSYTENLLQRADESNGLTASIAGIVAGSYLELRELNHALALYQKAIELDSEGNYGGTLHHQKGMVYQEQRKWESALQEYDRAIEANKTSGMLHELGGSYHQRGRVYEEQRKWASALQEYDRAIEANKVSGMLHELGGSYHQRGRVYEEQREWTSALQEYDRVIDANKASGMLHKLGGSYHQRGRVYEEQGKWASALQEYDLAIEAKKASGMLHELGSSHHQKGIVYEEQGEWASALQEYDRAIAAMKASGMLHQLGSSHHQKGSVYQEQREWASALQQYDRAIEAKKASGMLHELGNSYHQKGRVYQEQREWVSALQEYDRAIAAMKASGMDHQLPITHWQIGKVYEAQNQPALALENYLTALLLGVQHKDLPERVDAIYQAARELVSKHRADLPKELLDSFQAIENSIDQKS